jgi:hypothetical protein
MIKTMTFMKIDALINPKDMQYFVIFKLSSWDLVLPLFNIPNPYPSPLNNPMVGIYGYKSTGLLEKIKINIISDKVCATSSASSKA